MLVKVKVFEEWNYWNSVSEETMPIPEMCTAWIIGKKSTKEQALLLLEDGSAKSINIEFK